MRFPVCPPALGYFSEPVHVHTPLCIFLMLSVSCSFIQYRTVPYGTAPHDHGGVQLEGPSRIATTHYSIKIRSCSLTLSSLTKMNSRASVMITFLALCIFLLADIDGVRADDSLRKKAPPGDRLTVRSCYCSVLSFQPSSFFCDLTFARFLLANSAKQFLKTTKDVETNYKNFFKKPKTKLLIMKLAGTCWSKKNMKP
jgi:hypothetical protein